MATLRSRYINNQDKTFVLAVECDELTKETVRRIVDLERAMRLTIVADMAGYMTEGGEIESENRTRVLTMVHDLFGKG